LPGKVICMPDTAVHTPGKVVHAPGIVVQTPDTAVHPTGKVVHTPDKAVRTPAEDKEWGDGLPVWRALVRRLPLVESGPFRSPRMR
jgi:hypothetical protein